VSIGEGPGPAATADGGTATSAGAASDAGKTAADGGKTAATAGADGGGKTAATDGGATAKASPAPAPAAAVPAAKAAEPVAAKPHHPDPASAVERCNRAWRDAAGSSPQALIPGVVKGCLDLYTLAPCKDAWATLAAAPPDTAARALAQVIKSCRKAYCPELPRAAARMCQLPEGPPPKGTPQLTVLWGELHEAILRYELGPAQKQHLLANVSDPRLKALSRTLQGAAPAAHRLFAADGTELVQPVVTITEGGIVLWSRSGLEGTLTQPRGLFQRVRVVGEEGERAKVPVFEYAALNRALLELVKKRWPDAARRPDESKQIEVQTRGEFPYAVVLEVMKHVQKVREVPGEPPPKEAGLELFPHVQLSSLPGLAKPKREPQRVRRIRRRPY
jgi:hypothetical protein